MRKIHHRPILRCQNCGLEFVKESDRFRHLQEEKAKKQARKATQKIQERNLQCESTDFESVDSDSGELCSWSNKQTDQRSKQGRQPRRSPEKTDHESTDFKALVSAEAFPKSFSDALLNRGIAGYQAYASADLGARGFRTFRKVVLPLSFPAVVAGSIFTFSLTLGDYIAPELVGNKQFIGHVIFDNVGEAVMDASMKCTAYNGRYLVMGFASDKTVADEPFIVPRRVAAGNLKLCGVLLAYAQPEVATMVKQAMGFNFLSRELGEQMTRSIIELVRAGAVRPVVGREVAFEDLPAAIDAMANRETTGRTIITVNR